MIPGRVQEFMSIVNDSVQSYDETEEKLKFGLFLTMSITSANRREMSRELDKFYSTFGEWKTKTPWQLHEENVDFEMGLGNWSTLKQARYWPVSVLMPALGRINEIAYRNKMQVEVLITTLAIIRFKQITGDYPESLDGLVVAGYLKHLPMDPWSDKPLIYKKMDGDFTLYSVSHNFKDDGGQVYRDEEGRPRLWNDESGDAVFWPVPK